jgi:hypothetical protein
VSTISAPDVYVAKVAPPMVEKPVDALVVLLSQRYEIVAPTFPVPNAVFVRSIPPLLQIVTSEPIDPAVGML